MKRDSRRERVGRIHNLAVRVTFSLCKKSAVFKWFEKLYNIMTHSNSCLNATVTLFSEVRWSLLRELAALLNVSVPVEQC